jgi:hypothetical protein
MSLWLLTDKDIDKTWSKKKLFASGKIILKVIFKKAIFGRCEVF